MMRPLGAEVDAGVGVTSGLSGSLEGEWSGRGGISRVRLSSSLIADIIRAYP